MCKECWQQQSNEINEQCSGDTLYRERDRMSFSRNRLPSFPVAPSLQRKHQDNIFNMLREIRQTGIGPRDPCTRVLSASQSFVHRGLAGRVTIVVGSSSREGGPQRGCSVVFFGFDFFFLSLYFFVRCGVCEDCGRSVRVCLPRVRTTTLTPSLRHLTRRTRKGIFGDYGLPGWMRAWDTGDRSGNWVLFKIERHPEHHLKAGPSRSLSALIPAVRVSCRDVGVVKRTRVMLPCVQGCVAFSDLQSPFFFPFLFCTGHGEAYSSE